MTLHNYTPIKVIGIWLPLGVAQINIVDGRVDGEFASFARDNDDWVEEHDAHGNETRTKMTNRGGNLAITLSKSSPTNALLSAANILDRETETVVGPLTLKDMSGTTLIQGVQAYLKGKPSTISFGNSRGDYVWNFRLVGVTDFAGGHTAL